MSIINNTEHKITNKKLDRSNERMISTFCSLCGPSMACGLNCFVKDGKLHYIYNYVARNFYHVESNVPVPEGHHQLRYEFEVTGKPDILKG